MELRKMHLLWLLTMKYEIYQCDITSNLEIEQSELQKGLWIPLATTESKGTLLSVHMSNNQPQQIQHIVLYNLYSSLYKLSHY